MKNYNDRDTLPCCKNCVNCYGYPEYLTCSIADTVYEQVSPIGLCDNYKAKEVSKCKCFCRKRKPGERRHGSLPSG
jgi:hypothetical protein